MKKVANKEEGDTPAKRMDSEKGSEKEEEKVPDNLLKSLKRVGCLVERA